MKAMSSSRAVPRLRRSLGERLRAFRQERSLSQDRLGSLAGLSGKFIGEVERGQKSISLDSLYHVATALGVPVRMLIDVPAARNAAGPSAEALKVYTLVARQSPGDLQNAYRVIRRLLN
jgi:transcriptional regulator with XRE-family HTH domain